MSSEPTFSFIAYTPPPPDTDTSPNLSSERDRLRALLRWTEILKESVPAPSTRRCGMWPAAFRNLSKIGGGMASLRELHRLWHLTEPAEGEERLRFEPSTAEDRANAARDPVSVHPNPGMLSAADAGEPDSEESPVVETMVLHPVDLEELGSHASTTPAGSAPLAKGEKRPRNQRSDVKKRRRRATDSKPHLKRLPKRGVTSRKSVIPGDAGAGPGDGERAGKRARMDYAVDDPLYEVRWIAPAPAQH